MKKIISLFLVLSILASLSSVSFAEALKDTNVIGEIKYSDPDKINLSEEELSENPRSRSSKLRVAEKI